MTNSVVHFESETEMTAENEISFLSKDFYRGNLSPWNG